jgi:hypothetical protein
MPKTSVGWRWPILGLLVLTLACFALALSYPIFVIPALFLSAWLISVARLPWQWFLVLALALLGLTAIVPSFGMESLSDGLGVTAYAIAVVAVTAGLIEVLSEG